MTPCPWCGSQDSRLRGTAGDRLFRTSEKQYHLWKCARCGVIFLHPPPPDEELAACYPDHYWWGTQQPRAGWLRLLEGWRRFLVQEHVRRIRRLASSSPHPLPRWLDIGCGDGLLLDACHNVRVKRLGMDVTAAALHSARQRRTGNWLLQGRMEELPLADGSVTIVSATDVLEHVSAPLACLQEIHRVLQPQGWLIVQVPNAASWQCRLLGLSWAGFDVPRHLFTYSSHNLTPVLESKGFRVARVSHFSLRDNSAAIVLSLFPRLYPPARRRNRGHRTVRMWPDRLLDLLFLVLVLTATPLAIFESLLRQGGTIVVEAQKK